MLTDLSLLSLDWSTRLVRVHDLLREYLLPADPQRLTALHRQLLHSWGDPLSLQDSYRIRWYAYHLDSADESERLYALITPTWRDRVLAVTGALSDAAADILRTAEHAARHGHFPEELRCRLIGTAVAAYVRGLPPALLAAFARLGRLTALLAMPRSYPLKNVVSHSASSPPRWPTLTQIEAWTSPTGSTTPWRRHERYPASRSRSPPPTRAWPWPQLTGSMTLQRRHERYPASQPRSPPPTRACFHRS